jgi:hypothetical protein
VSIEWQGEDAACLVMGLKIPDDRTLGKRGEASIKSGCCLFAAAASALSESAATSSASSCMDAGIALEVEGSVGVTDVPDAKHGGGAGCSLECFSDAGGVVAASSCFQRTCAIARSCRDTFKIQFMP